MRMCPTCKSTGAIVRKPGGVDACPDCAKRAEEIYEQHKKMNPKKGGARDAATIEKPMGDEKNAGV